MYGPYWVDRPPLMIVLFKLGVLGGDRGVRVLGAVAALALVLLIALLARAVAGEQAARIAGLLAALLTGSVAIMAVYTVGELLAAVPSTLSVLCLVLAHRSRQTRFVFAAGAAAMSAVLVKQSFLDAGFAGCVFVIVSAVLDREVRVRWPVAYAAGAAAPLLVVLVWLAAAQVSVSFFAYTMFGFRLDLLRTLADSSLPLHLRIKQLEEPSWDSGLTLVLVGSLAGFVALLSRPRPAGDVRCLAGRGRGRRPRRGELLRALPDPAGAGRLRPRLGRARPGPLADRYRCAWCRRCPGAHGCERGQGVPGSPHAVAARARRRPVHPGSRPDGRHPVRHVRAAQRRLLRPPPASLSVPVEPHCQSPARSAHAVAAVAGLEPAPTWLVPWHHPSSWELDPGHSVARAIQRGYRRPRSCAASRSTCETTARRPPGVTEGACPSHVAWKSLG